MKVTWTSPSNIALVKYWGKFGTQLPQNPSISFTLKNSFTTLSLNAEKKENSTKELNLDFFFEGQSNEKFKDKIAKFLLSQGDQFPWLFDYQLTVESSNTFPHSSGIASSASSMSALCLSVLSMDEMIMGKKLDTDDFLKKASVLARLASGSASRSVYGGVVSWGETPSITISSDLYATPFLNINPVFANYRDTILIVDKEEKAVSSRAGHGLMENHPFKDIRYKRARLNHAQIITALEDGDTEKFIEIVEEEALMLHALMMTSNPSYILLKPHSLWLIEKIRSFRKENNIPVCFTIDAGPNIHLLYPKIYESAVKAWVDHELVLVLEGQKVIHDEVGKGPILLEKIK